MRACSRQRGGWATATAIAVCLATFTGLPAAARSHAHPAEGSAADVSTSDALARKLGFQLVPKRASVKSGLRGLAQTDPRLSLVPDPAQSDLHYWNSTLKEKSKQRRAASAKLAPKSLRAVDPLLVDEAEPDAVRGGNDSPANAQLISTFGSSSGKRSAARVLGTVAPIAVPDAFPPVPEDNGSIPLATPVALVDGTSKRTTGIVGDGPYGSAKYGTGDFDFYALRGAQAGQRLVVDIDTPEGNPNDYLDSTVILWDADGKPIAGNDDDGGSIDSLLSVTVPAAGEYFVSVSSIDSIPADPFDSGSGEGAGNEGTYTVTFGVNYTDIDYYAVDLQAGDVLSGTVSGTGSRLAYLDSAFQEVFGSRHDGSGYYPESSPLTGGGNAVADHVVGKDGRYYVVIEGAPGDYPVTLDVYRPATESRKATQTIFLDFDGGEVDTSRWWGWANAELSPLSAFLGRWGIPASQENALISQVIATVTENLQEDLAGTGVKVNILNSRDHADPFGQPDVSRLIIGGTRDESGVDTIGIAQSIDPGNFDTEETALILLDVLSDPPDPEREVDPSLNAYLTPASNRVNFVGTALGNVASHEAGHYLGNWHVDQFNTVLNLMDQGGNYPLLFGVGADGVGGTADDPDVDYGPDIFNPAEGFTGVEDTGARVRWGLAP